MNVDDGLEDIRWIRGIGGKRLPAASYAYALRPNLKKSYFCDPRRIEFFVVCFLLTSGQTLLYQTPGRCPPRIIGHVVNTARGWVGAPNERVPFRFHDAVVVFVN